MPRVDDDASKPPPQIPVPRFLSPPLPEGRHGSHKRGRQGAAAVQHAGEADRVAGESSAAGGVGGWRGALARGPGRHTKDRRGGGRSGAAHAGVHVGLVGRGGRVPGVLHGGEGRRGQRVRQRRRRRVSTAPEARQAQKLNLARARRHAQREVSRSRRGCRGVEGRFCALEQPFFF